MQKLAKIGLQNDADLKIEVLSFGSRVSFLFIAPLLMDLVLENNGPVVRSGWTEDSSHPVDHLWAVVVCTHGVVFFFV